MKKYICIIVLGIFPVFSSYAIELTKQRLLFQKAEALLRYNNEKNQAKGELLMTDLTGTSVDARSMLGWWYIKIQNTSVDNRKKGVSLVYSAYLEGNKEAGYFMAVIYKYDVDIYGLKNEKKAIDLLRHLLISDNDHPADKEETLGRWLLEENTERNKKEAIFWLTASFDHGNDSASSILAPLFTDNEEKDFVKAWFYSDLNGTSMAKEKHELEKQMTPEQIEQAQNMSWKWQDAHNVRMPGYRGNGSPIHWQVEYH